jgi:hypothetical protein
MAALQRIFGWKTAKKIAAAGNELHLSLSAKWDEMLYKIF